MFLHFCECVYVSHDKRVERDEFLCRFFSFTSKRAAKQTSANLPNAVPFNSLFFFFCCWNQESNYQFRLPAARGHQVPQKHGSPCQRPHHRHTDCATHNPLPRKEAFLPFRFGSQKASPRTQPASRAMDGDAHEILPRASQPARTTKHRCKKMS